MTKQEAQRLVERIRAGVLVPRRQRPGHDAVVYVSDYGPGQKTICVLDGEVEREYRSEEEFVAGEPAREGLPAANNELRSYPRAGLRLG